MSNYGVRKLGGTLTFTINTHNPSTGAATAATGSPSYRVYEDETATAILTGSMATLDSGNTTGFYSEELTLSAANGFEFGKSYNVYIEATVSGTTGTISHNFSISMQDTLHDGVVFCTATTGGTTTSIVCSSVDPSGGDGDFETNTVVTREMQILTGNEAGQRVQITDYTQSTLTFTLNSSTPLSSALASGDLCVVL